IVVYFAAGQVAELLLTTSLLGGAAKELHAEKIKTKESKPLRRTIAFGSFTNPPYRLLHSTSTGRSWGHPNLQNGAPYRRAISREVRG
ncbi:MAG: hypothetical protein WA798_14255, partial [Candidatus Acidiferrum sp.]